MLSLEFPVFNKHLLRELTAGGLSKKLFSEVAADFYNYIHPKTGESASLLSEEVWKVVEEHKDLIDRSIIHGRDCCYDYFGFKTLEKSCLLKIKGKIDERPQHMLMRVSLGIHMGDVPSAIETYNLLSQKHFTHATPTLFNAGTPRPQMSSCGIAIYLEPWHPYMFPFLYDESDRARGIFYALWTPDLFMKRVQEDGVWTLMCPNECPGLVDCYGEEFEKL